jgi:hypothetical protein
MSSSTEKESESSNSILQEDKKKWTMAEKRNVDMTGSHRNLPLY